MMRLSVPMRHALSRLTLPVLMVAAFGLLLLGKADALLASQLRMMLGDSLAPIYAAVAAPVEFARDWLGEGGRMLTVMHDNAVLREENDRLRKWQTVALALDAENATLKANLHWIPDAAPSFVTARVVADTGGIYARSVLVSIGPNHFVAKGQIALDDRGLVGRVTELGERSARILLITDLNSRVPVMLANSHAQAIMVGTNAERPRLIYLPQNAKAAEGERVVTSGEANVYPADLPVGAVHYNAKGVPEIIPEARLDRMDVVRLFDYGLRGLVPPEAPMQKSVIAALPTLPPAPPYWHTAPDRDPANRAAYIAALKQHALMVQQAADAAAKAATAKAAPSPPTDTAAEATPD
jgi:rod shape-determining protein MreC